MKNTTTARALRLAPAALVAAVLLLLTGCAQTPPASQEQPFTPAATNEVASRTVTLLEIVEPDLFLVTPAKSTDPLFGEEFQVHVYGLDMPSDDECGAAEALAWTNDQFAGLDELKVVYPTRELLTPGQEGAEPARVDADGVHQAWIGTPMSPTNFFGDAVGNGYGTLEDGVEVRIHDTIRAGEAAELDKGLHATCPGFGS